MPNRLGLKFPNRNFGREQATKPASPVLAPLPSPPVTSSPSPSPPKPPAEPDKAVVTAVKDTMSAVSAEKAQAHVSTASNLAPAVEQAAATVLSAPAGTDLEPKRRLHSRFTEEHLLPVLPDRRAEAVRENAIRPAPQPSESEPTPLRAPAAAVQTQTSTVGQLATDSDMPLHGFRRHMSLRDPQVGIEQLNAVMARRQQRHEAVGPSDDDIMASAQAAAVARRRASTEKLNTMQGSTGDVSQTEAEAPADDVMPQPEVRASDNTTDSASASQEGAAATDDTVIEAAAEADSAAAPTQLMSDNVADPDVSTQDGADLEADQDLAVNSAVKDLRAQSADHYESNEAAAVAAAVDDAQAEAVQQYETAVAADVDDAVGQLNDDAVDASLAEQNNTVGKTSALHESPKFACLKNVSSPKLLVS